MWSYFVSFSDFFFGERMTFEHSTLCACVLYDCAFSCVCVVHWPAKECCCFCCSWMDSEYPVPQTFRVCVSICTSVPVKQVLLYQQRIRGTKQSSRWARMREWTREGIVSMYDITHNFQNMHMWNTSSLAVVQICNVMEKSKSNEPSWKIFMLCSVYVITPSLTHTLMLSLFLCPPALLHTHTHLLTHTQNTHTQFGNGEAGGGAAPLFFRDLENEKAARCRDIRYEYKG